MKTDFAPDRILSTIRWFANRRLCTTLPALAAAALALPWTAAAGSGAPRLVCEQPVFDFGAVVNRTKIRHVFVLQNAGDAELIIRGVRATCGCTHYRLDRRRLAPDQTAHLDVTLLLADIYGLVRKTLYVVSNTPHAPSMRLEMRGRVTRDVEVLPAQVVFGPDLAGPGAARKQVRVRSGTGRPFRITGITTGTKAFFTAGYTTDIPGRQYTVHLALKPGEKYPPGTILRQELFVLTDNPRCPKVRVAVLLYLPEAIVVSPKEIRLKPPPAKPRLPGAYRLVLWSPRHIGFSVLKVGLPQSEARSEFRLTGKGIWEVRIQGLHPAPDMAGTAVTIRVRTADGTLKTLRVPIR